LEVFINQLHEDELQREYFQQDGAPPHVAHQTINYLQEFFGDRLVSRDRWPPRSPDLTPLDFYLFGSLKTKVFRNRIHTLEELQAAIVEEINNIDQHTLQRVFNNMKKKRVNMTLLNKAAVWLQPALTINYQQPSSITIKWVIHSRTLASVSHPPKSLLS
jgi:hypothetical protein